VHQAAQYLRAKTSALVGMNASGKLTGVISQSDVSTRSPQRNKCPAWMKTSDIMTRELVTGDGGKDARRVLAADGAERHLSLNCAG